jgi:hypothetical protein
MGQLSGFGPKIYIPPVQHGSKGGVDGDIAAILFSRAVEFLGSRVPHAVLKDSRDQGRKRRN